MAIQIIDMLHYQLLAFEVYLNIFLYDMDACSIILWLGHAYTNNLNKPLIIR